ncbi:BrnT family toxin [Wenxinia marina]|uniref:BrnT family toxin n=1 Tax=Wenxinia marina DSM 24838 TaxID=1123501 RepID=A0A0D0NJK2_9RHOB|nr:BrnT family toxin [Wenxinia marina]KIQ68510.1 hypothetical protein Wenmar_02781 [Wenxinia marina DSM 24838]GGL66475.1 hypothetical protein GCM10011392_21210 [Wenxinia marina]
MDVEYDEDKRRRILAERGLDVALAAEIWEGPHLDFPDMRQDYRENRIVTVGYIGARLAIVVWTERGSRRRVISMRKANEREKRKYAPDLAGRD